VAEPVDRAVEPEQAIAGHQPAARGLGRVRLAENLSDRAKVVDKLLQARPLWAILLREQSTDRPNASARGSRKLVIGEVELPLDGDQHAGRSSPALPRPRRPLAPTSAASAPSASTTQKRRRYPRGESTAGKTTLVSSTTGRIGATLYAWAASF
jgi:hypothetical protein